MKKKMQFTFSLMNEEEARTVFAWHYDAPYAVYDMSNDDTASVAGFLDRRSPYYAVRDEQGELVGYFGFGTAGMVGGYDEPALYVEDGLLTIGCGMRPDLTGRGMGLAFVNAGLEFAGKHLRLSVSIFLSIRGMNAPYASMSALAFGVQAFLSNPRQMLGESLWRWRGTRK